MPPILRLRVSRINIDPSVYQELINNRFAYVSVSRASHDAQIYTNDATSLVRGLSYETTKAIIPQKMGSRRGLLPRTRDILLNDLQSKHKPQRA